jgi:hypothetical protein
LISPTKPISAVLAGTRNSTPTPMPTTSPSGWSGPARTGVEAVMHLHYGLLADILVELSRSLAARDPLDELHRTELSEAAKQLVAALEPHEKS